MNCKICGKPLSPKQKSYCSAECAVEGRRKRERKAKITRYCQMCGHIIEDESRKVYCSDECARSNSPFRKKNNKIHDRIKNIKKTDEKARLRGVSYGKYMAMQYLNGTIE